jgi:hypothetical protein
LVDLKSLHFGDDDLAQLKSLDHIHTMRVAKSEITDDGLKYFRNFPQLKQLYLDRCQITDAGIDNLGDMLLGQLDFLDLAQTPVSQAKVDELRMRYPKLEILGKPRFKVIVLSRPTSGSDSNRIGPPRPVHVKPIAPRPREPGTGQIR